MIFVRNGLILTVCMAVLGLADYAGSLAGIDNYFYDLAFRVRGERVPDSNIIIAAIDEKTLAELGRWPIARQHYARLLEKLDNAQAVGIDLILAEPSEDDAELGEAVTSHGRVVLPVYFDTGQKLYCPVKELTSAAVGHTHLEHDIDGVVRQIFHNIADSSEKYPSFSSALETLLKGESSVADKGGRSVAPVQRLVQTVSRFINYYGGRETFLYVSVADILQDQFEKDFFSGRIVLVGVTATGVEAGILTPFSQNRNMSPGVEIHATVLNNLLDGSAISRAPVWMQWGGTLLLAIMSMLVFARLQVARAAILWCVVFFITPLAVFVPFVSADFWLPPATLMGALFAAFVISYIYHLETMAGNLSQARQDWEDSFNAIADGIVICDGDARVVQANIAGVALIQGPFADLFQPENRKDFVRPQAGSRLFEREEGCYAVSSHRRLSGSGEPCGSVIVVSDITAQLNADKYQRQLEEQFFQVQKMESIGRLAGGVAHDFNNILTAILGYGELGLIHIPEDHPARENIQIVLDAGNRGAELTRQLLAFSRKDRQEVEIVQPNRLVGNIARMLQRLIGEDIVFKLDIDSPVQNIEVDPGQIEQVIMNLVVNSRDAMPDGGILRLGTEDRVIDKEEAGMLGGLIPGRYVVIFVEDSGEGISPEKLKHIFEPFYTTKEEGKGTGLGLSIVWSMVKQHNGHVHVQTRPGEATRFEVFLPASGKSEEELVTDRTDIMFTGKEKVLVVENHEQIRSLIASILSSMGYTVVTVADAAAAIEVGNKEKGPVDLLLTDVILPVMDGVKLAEKISAIHPNMQVLYMSGYPQETITRYGVLDSDTAFIQKPLTPTKLASAVRKTLDSPV